MSPVGGSELNAVRTVEQLVRRGHSVTAVTLTSDISGMYGRYRAAGADVIGFPVDSLVGVQAIRAVRQMAAFFRKTRVDVVHSHDKYTNFLMVTAARLAGITSIASKRYTQHYERKHIYTDRFAFRIATGVLVNSVGVGHSAEMQERVAPSRITVIPNFVDDDLFLIGSERTALRRSFGIDEDAIVIAIVAQLRGEKNHSVLLTAFAALRAQRPSLRLIIAGDGPERIAIESLVAELQMKESVTMTGHMDRAWRAFSAADIAVLPSQHEGFPNSVVEAMAMGVPVIASNVGGIPDAVEDGRTGLLVAPGDAESLRRALVRLIDDEMFRRSAGESSRIKAGAEFRASAVIDRLELLYDNLLEKHS